MDAGKERVAAENEEPKKVEAASVETQAAPAPVAPVTAAVIREDLVAELELLGGRAKGKLAAYARQSLAVLSSVLDGLDDKPPAKDAPAEKKG